MASVVVEGGHRLKGSITPEGAKNEALQVIWAGVLTTESVIIENIPQILDVLNLIALLEKMGVEVERLTDHTFSFKAEKLNRTYIESDAFLKECSKLRGSVMLIGPLTARLGRSVYAKPGGDKIGRRRLDTHFVGIQKLGAALSYDNERRAYVLESHGLKGCDMLLDEASVTGTANIVMAAVLAKGRTTIYNAACEPYIQQLCRLLQNMAAKI